ncbi:hypothetical protein A2434_01780 [Candidatus Woesebacteria bacterium RIFOXYC1_FULL_41_14]|uniref:Mannosyl-glycoprotein endo-beta-N-acetylglucosamidase-like domain-containing protein n=2 Tax=Candidatus Woeseibacteriota TaxID=1752722 RepID=A0A1F8DIL7_9BACT|nr:MAG: hypothetical protein A2393_00980 [Candidatus Woesebacteria bacterium RIFOXYB1_FULL_41_13]OGM84294.1 MAG: hypothetical protein A2434_01780 [Candidatus Woesebacteria bacterium RIFOXYC1_FULL_41_14]OGM88262.1 MAG: hypothetical protein A2594_02625 [Candidatus Woesebacteria bacterium RIFOXYD1_FULL_41_28]
MHTNPFRRSKIWVNLTYPPALWHSDLMDRSILIQEDDFGFWKNLILVTVFFIITPVTIGVSLFSLFSLKKNDLVEKKFNTTNLIISPKPGVSVYAALPGNVPTVSSTIEYADARPKIVEGYLIRYDSPLAPYSDLIVQTADKYHLDFRLITAIAQQESNLCKIIPPGSYNCWGWGITSVGTLGFDSFADGIETVSSGIRSNYLDKGYSTIEEIMSKYTPQSNGSWAFGVNSFMEEME